MLVRVFFSFKNETNHPRRFDKFEICTEIKEFILDGLEQEKIFDYYFYQDDKGHHLTDHIIASRNANYFIFFIEDRYNRSLNCKKEYHFFNENHAFPKRLHVIYQHKNSKNKLKHLANLDLLDDLAERDRFELRGIKSPSEVCTDYNLYETKFWVSEQEKEIFEPLTYEISNKELVRRRGGEILKSLEDFVETVKTEFSRQIYVSGNFKVTQEQYLKLMELIKDGSTNKKIFYSPYFMDVKPFMPNIRERNGENITSWQTDIDKTCIEAARNIIFFIDKDKEIDAPLKRISRWYDEGDRVTIVSNNKLPQEKLSGISNADQFTYYYKSAPETFHHGSFVKQIADIVKM